MDKEILKNYGVDVDQVEKITQSFKEEKNSDYYHKHNLYTPEEHKAAQSYDIDKDTGLPFGFGYDHIIHEYQQ